MFPEAWKVVFPSLRLPVKLIGVFPLKKSPLVVAPHKASHQEPPTLMHQSTNHSSKLKVKRNKNLESQLLKDCFKALKATVLRTNQVNSSNPSPTGSICDAPRDLDST
jgi:hypothetical protein